jgi:hypothetical protein
VSLRMLLDLRLTTAQQRTTGPNLPSDLYVYSYSSIICLPVTLLQSIVSNPITGWSYLTRRVSPTLAVPEKPNSLPHATLSTLR